MKTSNLLTIFILILEFSAFNLQGKVDFNRQIRPILSDKCYKCHGPDAKNQKSDFRIDSFEEAIKEHNGFVGLTPGNLEESEIHWRIYSDDPIDVMPPPESKHPLTEAEKKMIDQGSRRVGNMISTGLSNHYRSQSPCPQANIQQPKMKLIISWLKHWKAVHYIRAKKPIKQPGCAE